MVTTADAAGLPCLAAEEAIARVYRVLGPGADLEESCKGTAFLLDEFHLVTCAHVVAAAVGKGLKDGTWLTADLDPGTAVRVQEAGPYAEPFEAEVKFYKPHDSHDFTADVAILELKADQSLAAPFSPTAPEHGAALRAFGFPAGHKRTGGWVDVTTSGDDALGWLQVEKRTLNGVPVKGGISGTPVWLADLSAVVGMITMADEKTGVAHIIPYEQIRKAAEAVRRLPRIASADRDVFESLLRLDFEPQMTAAGRIAGQQRSAILVHGDADYGQRMLLERIKRSNKLDNTFFLKVELGRVTLRLGKEKIYRDVARWLEINPSEAVRAPELLYQAIARRLRLKDTVIIFLPDVQTPKEVVDEVITGFWQPLVKSLQNVAAAKKRLMVLILDERACRKLWGALDVVQSTTDWRPELPLELPALSPIEKATLEDWLVDAATPFVDPAARSLITELLYEQSNNGIPEWVFHHYCRMRALSWSEVRHRWLER